MSLSTSLLACGMKPRTLVKRYIPALQRNLPFHSPPPTFRKDDLDPPWPLSSLKYDTRVLSKMSVPNYKVPIVTSDSTVNVTDNFDGRHPDLSSLGTITINVTGKRTYFLFYFILIKLATFFDPTGSSSGLHYEPFNYKVAYILGIPNNVYK